MLGSGEPTLRQRQIAALTYAGPNAVLTGLGGARLLGLRRGGEPEGQHLSAELDAASRKGRAAPRRVMHALEVGVESPAEYRYLEFWLSIPGLPAVQCNVPVSAPDGTLVGIADFLVPELGFVWECDSVEEHFATPTQVWETAERARALRALGLCVLSTRPTQRRDDPRGVESDIRHGLAVAASMPPPQAIFGRSRAA